MARDAKTTFQHQSDLHSKRPSIDPDSIKSLAKARRIHVAASYNMFMKDDEMAVIFALSDGNAICLRLNPDVVLNLGMNLLKAGAEMGWFDAVVKSDGKPIAN